MSDDRDLCGFDASAPSSYEALASVSCTRTVVGAPPRGKATRPGVVKDALAAHKIATKPLVDAAAKLGKRGGIRTLHAPIRHRRVMGVDYIEVIGAPPVRLARPLTPKQKKALEKYNKLAETAKKKTTVTQAAFKKAVSSLKANASQVAVVAKGHMKSVDPRRKIIMVGGDGTVFGADDLAHQTVAETGDIAAHDMDVTTWLGQDLVSQTVAETGGLAPVDLDVTAWFGQDEPPPADPDPANPGYLTDGTPDPDYPGGDVDTSGVTSELTAEEKAAIARAALLDSPVKPPPLNQAVKKVLSGVVYDGSKGWPKNKFGSDSYFKTIGTYRKTNQVWGWVWGWDLFPSGRMVDTTTARWVVAFGNDPSPFAGNGLNWDDFNREQPDLAGDVDAVSKMSLAGQRANGSSAGSPTGTFGPLVGAPGSDFANLRYATEDKKWFWYPSEAPDWATVEIRNEAALAQKKAEQLAKDAAAAKRAADEKIKADQEAQQAAEEFKRAMEEKEAAAETKKKETARAEEDVQTEREQAKAERERAAEEAKEAATQAREDAKMAAEERRAELEAAREDAKVAAEQARADIEAQRAETESRRRIAEARAKYAPATSADDEAPPEEGYSDSSPEDEAREEGFSGPGTANDLLGWYRDDDPLGSVPYAHEDGRDPASLLGAAYRGSRR